LEFRSLRMIAKPSKIAARLVRDAGFDPVAVGSLDAAKRLDVGAPVYNTGMSGDALRQALGLKS